MTRSLVVLPGSLFVSLIGHYDHYLGRLLHCLLTLRPELLNATDRQLTFSQLAKFESIEDARSYVLEKEIETVLRKSHVEQFDWMEKRFSIQLRENLATWPRFVEVTQRRNLFAQGSQRCR